MFCKLVLTMESMSECSPTKEGIQQSGLPKKLGYFQIVGSRNKLITHLFKVAISEIFVEESSDNQSKVRKQHSITSKSSKILLKSFSEHQKKTDTFLPKF